MKIQVQYLQPVLLRKKQRYGERFRFYGTITLPALPQVGTTLWEPGSDDPDTATVDCVRLVPEDENPKRLTYEIIIISDDENITEWRDFDTWFKKKVEWLLGLGLCIDEWPEQARDQVKRIDSFDQFVTVCDKDWYDEVVLKHGGES